MTRLATLFRMTLTTAALPLVLAACGGGDATPAPNPPPPPAPAPDTTPPTLALSGTSSSTVNAAVTVTFTFSEDVAATFDVSDISVTNGAASAFAKVDATHYTALITPTANAAGTMTISVAAGSFSDVAGNASTTGGTATQPFDTTVPIVEYAVIDFTTAGLTYKQTDFGGSASSLPPVDTPPAGGPATVVEVK